MFRVVLHWNKLAVPHPQTASFTSPEQGNSSLHYNLRVVHHVIQQEAYNKLEKGYKKMWKYAGMTDPSFHLLRPYVWNCVIQQIIMSRVPGIARSRKVKWHQTRKAHPMSLWTSGTSSSDDCYEQLTSRHTAFPNIRGTIHLAALSLSINTT